MEGSGNGKKRNAAVDLLEFVRESNRIEGIVREPTAQELTATRAFLALSCLTVGDLSALVAVLQPGAALRTRRGMDVRVGAYVPPPGGPEIRGRLEQLLVEVTLAEATRGGLTPYAAHLRYENLHPFTDGNGRSGRAVWAWQMRRVGSDIPLGFLHQFYYQALAESGR